MKNISSLSRRFVGYLIDLYLSDLFFLCALYIVNSIHEKQFSMSSSLMELSKVEAIFAFVLGIVFVMFYYLLPSLLNPERNGQTPGKMFARTRVVKDNGKQLNVKDVFSRYIIGFVFVENSLTMIGFSFRTIIAMFVGVKIVNYIYYAYTFVSLLSISLLLMTKSRKMIHDLIAGTHVVINE